MTETDHCAENALAERINGILKSEYGLGGQFKTKADSPALRREAAQPTPEIIQEASRHTVKFKPGLDPIAVWDKTWMRVSDVSRQSSATQTQIGRASCRERVQ